MSASVDPAGPICIEPAKVHWFWPYVAPMLAKGFEKVKADDTLESLESLLRAKLALLWIVWDAAEKRITACAITRIVITETGKLLVIAAVAGRDLPRWPAFLSTLENFARVEGCGRIRLSGRPGWKRILADYHEPFITLEKELT